MKTVSVSAILAAAALFTAPAAHALTVQEVPAATAAPAEETSEVEQIVVSARRAGLPMWTVRKGDEGVLILVGMIREVPKDFEWRTEALESAVGRVDRVLLPQEMRASPADVLRMLWRARTIVMLPNGGRLDGLIHPDDFLRLLPLMAGERNETWVRTRPLMVAMDLVKEQTGEKDARDPRVERVAERAARRARLTTHEIGVVRGSELVETLISSPPETQIGCLRAAMSAAEYGPTAMADRAQSWSRQDVKAVIASPFDAVMDECWPWGDPAVRGRMRTEWVTAISSAIADEGVTLAVAPVRTLGEADGVLDLLVAQGFEIDGPEWK